MTQSSNIPDLSAIEKPVFRHEVRVLDAVLQLLSRAMSEGESEFPITLLVGGYRVEGYIIGAARFYELSAAELKAQLRASGDLEVSLDQVFATLQDKTREYLAESKDDPIGKYSQFIHLRAANFYPAFPNGREACWRVRMECVDGFSFGHTV